MENPLLVRFKDVASRSSQCESLSQESHMEMDKLYRTSVWRQSARRLGNREMHRS